MVELVFESEVRFRFGLAGEPLCVELGESSDVSTGAKGFGPCARDYDDGGQLGFLPFLQKGAISR